MERCSRVVLSWLVILLMHGCGATRPGTGAGIAEGEVSLGRTLYGRYCALCHGEQGEGYAADNATALASTELLATASDRFLSEAIVRGRPGTPMSAWGKPHGGPLDEGEARAIVAFIRTWQRGPAVPVDDAQVDGSAERGAAAYGTHCADCHGEQGDGGQAPTLDNPVFHDTASDGFIRYAIAQGRSGTPMPAFAESLSAATVDDLVAFVRSLRRDEEPRSARSEPTEADVVVNPDGPDPELSLRDGMYVPADQVKRALDEGARLVIVDARARSDYLDVHIAGAISLPFYEVEENVDRLPDDTWIVAYCACPHAASGRVVQALRERGFSRTAVLDEGLPVWIERGYPVERP